MENNKQNAYKEAGVDIEAGDALVSSIKESVKNTFRPGVMQGIGGFGACFDLKAVQNYQDPILVSSTDGVGTKLKIAIETGLHSTVGIDLVAMCVNDLIVQGAEPLFFLDYFASGKLDIDTANTVINGITAGCIEAGCALIGGETAEMPSMYAEKHYDLAGFTLGAVERHRMITGETIKPGDIVLGLASNGLHSNGFSLVRKIAEEHSDYRKNPEFSSKYSTLGEELLIPTKIYVKSILSVLQNYSLKGMANITGGGLIENIPRILPKGLGTTLDASQWALPPVMQWLQNKARLSDFDLSQTFNCGIGMTIIVSAHDADTVSSAFENAGETLYTIGKVTDQAGVTIENTETAWR